LRIHRQVGALRKVLSQQAIGILARPALPLALRIADEKCNALADSAKKLLQICANVCMSYH
jgi:hypothetical protein